MLNCKKYLSVFFLLVLAGKLSAQELETPSSVEIDDSTSNFMNRSGNIYTTELDNNFPKSYVVKSKDRNHIPAQPVNTVINFDVEMVESINTTSVFVFNVSNEASSVSPEQNRGPTVETTIDNNRINNIRSLVKEIKKGK